MLAGHIPLNRMDRKSQVQCLGDCKTMLAKGASVLFFPEGTRSQDARLGAFKKGAFTVAAKAKVPTRPVMEAHAICQPCVLLCGLLWLTKSSSSDHEVCIYSPACTRQIGQCGSSSGMHSSVLLTLAADHVPWHAQLRAL